MSTNKAPVPAGPNGIVPTTIEEFYRFAKYVCASGLAPSGLKTPEQCMIAMQSGMEIGMTPMQAVQSIYVVHGKAGMMAEAALAMVLRSGRMEWQRKGWEGVGDERHHWMESKRRGMEGVIRTTFSIADAKRAGLLPAKPDSGWHKWPDRMLQARNVGFHLRDYYPDALRGVGIAEELMDWGGPKNGKGLVEAPPPEEIHDPLLDGAEDADIEEANEAPAEEPEAEEAEDTTPRERGEIEF